MRVALVAGPDPGHAFPVVALAVALRARGHGVLVATGSMWDQDVAAEDLAFVELPLLAPTLGDEDVGYRVWRRAGQMAPPLAERLAPFDPEIVVTDTLTRAGAFAAELMGIAWVETSPHFLYDPDPLVPPVGLGARPARDPVRLANHASIRRQQQASFAAGRALGDQVRGELGLTGDGAPLGRLLATLPALEPRRSRWPERTYVVGALTWEPRSWPTLAPPAGNGPLVLVSDSTASDVTRTVGDVARTWLAGATDLRGVVTTSSSDVGTTDGRVVVGRGRHSPLLPDVDLVVGTAGHGLVTKALTAGVPLVLVPLHGDQRETAARVRRAGLGREIAHARLTPRRLDRVARAVLDEGRARRRAREVARGAQRLGPSRAAAVVERLAAARHDSAPR